jgi:hypothetical protein
MLPKDPKFDARPEAESLRQAVVDAFAALQLAQVQHERALEIPAGTESRSDDRITAIRQSGREYAAAVARYAEAAMAWLAFVDLHLEGTRKSASKSTTGA